LETAAFTITLPNALPGGDADLDFFSDLNGNRAYDAPPADHAWRVPIPADGQVSFIHNVNFTDIGAAAGSQGGDFALNLTGMTPHVGQLMEVRVIRTPEGKTVGAYRLGAIPGATFSLAIPGIIQSGQSYQVDFFADLNGNKSYDAPPADHAWRLTGIGTAAGLSLDFAHNVNFTDIQLAASGAPRTAARGPAAEDELEQEPESEVESSSGIQLLASLTGAQVVPPVTTTAAGSGNVVVSPARDAISFSLTVSPLPVTTVVLAHIHEGAPGVNGGVIFNLLPAGAAFTGALSGTLTAADFLPVITVTTFAQAVDAILAGNAYFQVHTLASPGGELRGQILP
jgi:hypothetical protein